MTLVSNDPSWWPFIDSERICSYIIVASSAGVMYDWVSTALTFGREIELVWVRYLGILYAVFWVYLLIHAAFPSSDRQLTANVPTISGTDIGCLIMFVGMIWMSLVVYLILGVIVIARLNAMYQRSRKVLIILIAIFLAVYIAIGALAAIGERHSSGEELILSGTYQCTVGEGGGLLLFTTTWIIGIVWEAVTLCFAVWIAVKHFRELRRYSAGGIIRDCFAVLMKTHAVYFVSSAAVFCFKFQFYYLYPKIVPDPYSLEDQFYYSISQNLLLVQSFVLGPRLILDVREYHATLVADSDAETGMTSVTFQERVHGSTSGSV
ncbi:hypothetical protein EV702DRAFT_1236040 [Suillus placidus]|uniref:Uncharacterized protein n=1 Tax=Suillus placidus TaxID=48579 RepID=A0A9P7D011_9AGAM|nr:hypothetical protein EV702DRAFT_1236040 [Suillus placidus]